MPQDVLEHARGLVVVAEGNRSVGRLLGGLDPFGHAVGVPKVVGELADRYRVEPFEHRRGARVQVESARDGDVVVDRLGSEQVAEPDGLAMLGQHAGRERSRQATSGGRRGQRARPHQDRHTRIGVCSTPAASATARASSDNRLTRSRTESRMPVGTSSASNVRRAQPPPRGTSVPRLRSSASNSSTANGSPDVRS